MSILDEKAKANQYPYNYPKFGMWAVEITEHISRNWFKKGYELCQKEFEDKLQWIPVDEKEVESFKNDEDGIYYSKYLELKVNGYEYPLIGYYVNANDDQFFYIISEKDYDIKQEDITHYRFIP